MPHEPPTATPIKPGTSSGDQRLTVEFYIAVITAEVMIDAGALSKVETVLQPQTVRRFWNRVAHMNGDGFVQHCALRAVRCLIAVDAHDAPTLRPLVDTIVGGVLFGPGDMGHARDALKILSETHPTLPAAVAYVARLARQCVTAGDVDALRAAVVAVPQTAHYVARLLMVCEHFVMRALLSADGVEMILGEEYLPGMYLSDILATAWVAGPVPAFNHATRCWALRCTAALCLAAPDRRPALLPTLLLAATAEGTPVSDTALALLWDLADIIPGFGAAVGDADAEGVECEGAQVLLEALGAKSVKHQRIAAHGVCRLLASPPAAAGKERETCRAAEYVLARLVQHAARVDTDPIVVSMTHTLLGCLAARGQHDRLADGVIQLCVEQYAAAPMRPRDPTLGFITRYIPPAYIPVVVSAVARNLVDFFGTAPEHSVILSWLH